MNDRFFISREASCDFELRASIPQAPRDLRCSIDAVENARFDETVFHCDLVGCLYGSIGLLNMANSRPVLERHVMNEYHGAAALAGTSSLDKI